jgi:hypothetical protein
MMPDKTDHLSRNTRAHVLAEAFAGNGDPALVKTVEERRAVVKELVSQGRRRRYAMGVQQKLDRALEAFVRRNYTDWDPTAPEAERTAANKETTRLIEAAGKGEGIDTIVTLVLANTTSRAVWDKVRDEAEKKMVAMVKTLPVAAFVNNVHGFALPGLSFILAETGSLDNYTNPAKIWSRLGFAPFEGFAMSSWTRETWRPRALTADEWIEHPFSAERYARMFMLAKPLRDSQWIGAKKTADGIGKPKPGMIYGQLYADRRAHCELTHPDWTPAHRDKDALRIMFKRLLADLWSAWIDTSFAPGHAKIDAQRPDAGSKEAAVGQGTAVAQHNHADGGTLTR